MSEAGFQSWSNRKSRSAPMSLIPHSSASRFGREQEDRAPALGNRSTIFCRLVVGIVTSSMRQPYRRSRHSMSSTLSVSVNLKMIKILLSVSARIGVEDASAVRGVVPIRVEVLRAGELVIELEEIRVVAQLVQKQDGQSKCDPLL